MTQINDVSWLRQSFLYSGNLEVNRLRAKSGNGWLKFTDTTLGGNVCINPPPQFTPFADIPESRLMPNIGRGMGRWYSENIDDYGHNVHIRVGVPAYTGLLGYALSAIDGPTARYVATGRTPGYMDTIATAGGLVVAAMFWEITLLATLVGALIKATHSRFYYLKPTMHQYWKTVQVLVNSVAANLGLTLESTSKSVDEALRRTQEHARLSLPDVWMKNGSIDIFAVACRAQALANRHKEYMLSLVEQGMSPESLFVNAGQHYKNSMAQVNGNGYIQPNYINGSIDAYTKSFNLSPYRDGVTESTSGNSLREVILGADVNEQSFTESVDTFASSIVNAPDRTSFGEALLAEFRDGASWVSFRVNNITESVSESWSNSSEESDIANIFNKFSNAGRSMMFNFAGGKTGIAPLDAGIDEVAGLIGDGLTKFASVTMGFTNPIIGLLYGAQIDIPKRWGGSKTSLPTKTIELEFRSIYANTFSIFQSVIVPLLMCIPLAAPRGTGPQSYGSPFYVQFYSKGRSQCSIGLVTSLTITRGIGNAPWTKDGLPRAVKVSMTIEDMTDIMYAPVNNVIESEILGMINPAGENAMGDYLATLSALGLAEQEYFTGTVGRKFNALLSHLDSFSTPHYWASKGHDLLKPLSAFFPGTNIRN